MRAWRPWVLLGAALMLVLSVPLLHATPAEAGTKQTQAQKTKVRAAAAKPAKKLAPRTKKAKTAPRKPVPAVSPSRYAAFIIDSETGQPLISANADEPRHPASLTKVMTLYMTFEAIERGRLRFDQGLPVSAWASIQSPTKLDLKEGETISVRDAVLGLITKSANDAAVVLAEALAGDEDVFAQQMTQKARQLGMSRTVFRNASGLPNSAQITTARDMSIMALAMMRDFPGYYHLFSTQEFTYNGRVHTNHNRMLGWYPGADGMKTGYTNASGFNLIMSAKRDGRRLVGVVMGGTSAAARDQQMAQLMDQAFAGDSSGTLVAKSAPAEKAAPTEKPAPRSAAAPVTIAGVNAPALSSARLAANDDDAPARGTPIRRDTAQGSSTTGRSGGDAGDYAIQVGAFGTLSAAQRAIKLAQANLPSLKGNSTAVIPVDIRGGRKLYRARLGGLGESQAVQSCRRLASVNELHCQIVRPDGRDVSVAEN